MDSSLLLSLAHQDILTSLKEPANEKSGSIFIAQLTTWLGKNVINLFSRESLIFVCGVQTRSRGSLLQDLVTTSVHQSIRSSNENGLDKNNSFFFFVVKSVWPDWPILKAFATNFAYNCSPIFCDFVGFFEKCPSGYFLGNFCGKLHYFLFLDLVTLFMMH